LSVQGAHESDASAAGLAAIDSPPDSVRNLERAIVAATLAGRHSTAELLADRLRERLAHDRANVVRLDDERQRHR
jgi:hypothetical protein